jgi:hypothetical protein
VKFRTLGILVNSNHPAKDFYEHRFLVWVKDTLTTQWPLIQGGNDDEALALWLSIFWVLELDRKATLDLMLLAHQGGVGRCEANEVLWQLVSFWAIKRPYEDLSNKCTSMVHAARRHIDRPPSFHDDFRNWSWSLYDVPRHPQWSPEQVPRDRDGNLVVRFRTGDGGVPLAPPQCWA